MSFVAVTFGYNQFEIFNTNTSTATFVDKIKEEAIGSIINSLKRRDTSLDKKIKSSEEEQKRIDKELGIKRQELNKIITNNTKLFIDNKFTLAMNKYNSYTNPMLFQIEQKKNV